MQILLARALPVPPFAKGGTIMATIVRRTSKNGQLSYRAQVRRKGAPPLSATFTKLSDARKWGQITEAAIIEGRHFKTVEAKRRTLADMLDRYTQDVLPQKRAGTVRAQVTQLHWWQTQIGHYTLVDVTPALIAKCRDTLKRTHASATVNRYLAVLSHAFTIGVREWEWCDDNPVRKIKRLREPRGRVRFLSEEERQRLLDACQVSNSRYLYKVVVLALATGARKGEILSLRWADVNFNREVLTFHETKNGERRTVPLTGQALTLMRQHAKVRHLNTTLVFPDVAGKQPADVRDAWECAVKRAGIADFRFHDLRHTAASYLAMNGASLMEIAEILGHSLRL